MRWRGAVAGVRTLWHHRDVRRASVANGLGRDDAALRPDERVARALALGERDVATYAAAARLTPADARRAVERRRQARRRRSDVLRGLVA
jgi:hypothetical protein